MQTVLSACFILVILSICAKEVFFCFVFLNLHYPVCSHVGPPFAKEGSGRLGGGGGMAHDILILFPAYDVTDTDCWAQNGSAPGCAFMTFKC